jgi:DNA-binding transcriptional ArsR family regulator
MNPALDTISAMSGNQKRSESGALPMPMLRMHKSVAVAKAKSHAVAVLAEALDAQFFRAIAEPVRQRIVLILLQQGRSSIQEVAQYLVQDRSVVSRHLAFLRHAGFVRSRRVQRSTEYELDGQAVIAKLEQLLAHLRLAAHVCCPPRDAER